MTPPTIQTIRVAGSHRQVGVQLGEAGRDAIRSAVAETWANLPAGRTRAQQLALAAEYRGVTEAGLPWLVDELDGCAAGAGVDPSDLFAWSIEELWYERRDLVNGGRCTDLVAGPAATADGHLLVGHNNDLHPDVEEQIVAIEKRVEGDPIVFQLGGIPWLSVGWSSAGLSLTGNELSPNDERIGVSRSHQVVEMLRARSLDEMVAMALRADRASSYNNVLTSVSGDVANVEGSATDAEVTRARRPGSSGPHQSLRLRPDAPVRRRRRLRAAVGGQVPARPRAAGGRGGTIDHPREDAHLARRPRGRARLAVSSRRP
jgi:isopenicillin-N N-acyltransferase like protein